MMDPSLWTADKKDSQWNGIMQILLESTRSAGKIHGHCLGVDDAEGVDITPRGQTINSDLYIQTIETCRSLSGELDLRKKYFWNPPSTRRTSTHKFENTGSNHTTPRNCCSAPTLQLRSCSRRFPHLWSLTVVICGKIFGSDDEVIEEVAASIKFKLVQEGDRYSCLSLAQSCWSSWRLCRKMRCVIHPSSYPMNMLKELNNKELAIKSVLTNFLSNLRKFYHLWSNK